MQDCGGGAHAQVDELSVEIVQLDLNHVQFLLADQHVTEMGGFIIFLAVVAHRLHFGFSQHVGARIPHHRTLADVAQDPPGPWH